MFSVDRIPMHFCTISGLATSNYVQMNVPRSRSGMWLLRFWNLRTAWEPGPPVTVKGNLGVTASLVAVPSPRFEDGCSCSHCTFPHLRKRIQLHSINIFGQPQPGHVERLWAYRAHIRFDQIRSATSGFLMEACHGHLNYSLIAVSTRHGLC